MGGKTAGLAADTRFTLTEMSTTADKRVIGHGAPPRERRNEVRGWYSSPSLRADPPVSQGLPGLGPTFTLKPWRASVVALLLRRAGGFDEDTAGNAQWCAVASHAMPAQVCSSVLA